MNDDVDYRIAKTMVETGQVHRLHDLFPIVPKTRIARDLKLRPAKFNNYINNIGLFTMHEIEQLAALIGVEYDVVHNILRQQRLQEQEMKNKTKKGISTAKDKMSH